MEGLKGAFDLVFRGNRGQVETMAASSGCQSKLFHSVDEVGPSVVAKHRLNDKCLVFECNEASAEKVRKKQNFKAYCSWFNAEIDQMWFFLMEQQRQVSFLSVSALFLRPNETLKYVLIKPQVVAAQNFLMDFKIKSSNEHKSSQWH